MKNSTLIFITRGFPYGRGESFISKELNFLARYFERIILFSRINYIYDGFNKNEKRQIPENVFVVKVSSLKNSWEFLKKPILIFKELYKLKSEKRLSFLNIKILVSYTSEAINLCNIILANKQLLTDNKLYGYSYWSFDEPLALIFLKKKIKIQKIISRFHGSDLFEEVQLGNYLPFRELYLKKLDSVITISKVGADYLTKKYNSSSDIKTHYLGVKLRHLKPYNSNQIRIVSVGAFDKNKRIDLIIKSLEKINKIKIVWDHFGAGPLESKIHLYAKNLLSEKSNINYTFHGYVTNSELINYFKNENVTTLLNTSKSEGIPASMMEAMSFGIPVVATDVGGVREIVNNQNGVLLDCNPSSISVSRGICNLVTSNKEQMNNYRTNAYITCKSKFNSSTNYNKFINNVFSE